MAPFTYDYSRRMLLACCCELELLLAWLTKQRQWGLVSGVAALEEVGPLGGGCSGCPPEALDEWMTISVKAVG